MTQWRLSGWTVIGGLTPSNTDVAVVRKNTCVFSNQYILFFYNGLLLTILYCIYRHSCKTHLKRKQKQCIFLNCVHAVLRQNIIKTNNKYCAFLIISSRFASFLLPSCPEYKGDKGRERKTKIFISTVSRK